MQTSNINVEFIFGGLGQVYATRRLPCVRRSECVEFPKFQTRMLLNGKRSMVQFDLLPSPLAKQPQGQVQPFRREDGELFEAVPRLSLR